MSKRAMVAMLVLIGFLTVGLLLPWINRLRGQASRVACLANLRTIGLALHAYHDMHQAFPTAVVPHAVLPPAQRLSWQVLLLPDTDKEGRYGNLQPRLPWDAAENAIAVRTPRKHVLCPAAPPAAEADLPGLTHYVGLAGLGKDAASVPLDDPAAGFLGFERQLTRTDLQDGKPLLRGRRGLATALAVWGAAAARGPLPPLPLVPLRARGVAKGTSNLVAVLETSSQNGPWTAGGLPTVRGLDPSTQPYVGRGRPFGGLHSGIVNVAFADGSADARTDKISPRILEALAIIGGDELPAGDQ